jgi:DNA-binding FadR family transcriptional regulator
MRVLIADIVTGTLAPGDMLPREADLAEQFSVSRGVARECIRGLEERGLITVKHGRGATVNPEQDWDRFSPEVLEALLNADRGAPVLQYFLECRRILEVEAAALAAERASAADLTAMEEAFSRMSAGAERAQANPAAEDLYHAADVDFHRAITNATRNPALGRMTEPLHRAFAARLSLARPQLRMQRSLPEHRRILAAIAERDADEAREAMRDHLRTVEGYLREYSEGLADNSALSRVDDGVGR